ncbi:MAG TPA: DUF6351 family protein, partial [Acidimicrobiales bacterium]|nr:DUF6351 family protein [Acidimicrobiales bacterium]
MRRAGAGMVVALLLAAACSGDDGGDGAPTTEASESAIGQAMAAQSSDGVTTTAVSAGGGLTVSTVSTRAEFVTGGDVLVEVSAPDDDVVVAVDGEQRPDPFGDRASTGRFREQALIDGLSEGDHLI